MTERVRDPIRLMSADGARAEVQPFGAHVTSWITPDGRERLYLSEHAAFDGRAAIRGGIPIIFPQFAGEGPLPKHGFARTAAWRVVPGGAPSSATFELTDTPATRALWPHAFRLRLTVSLEPGGLQVVLVVANMGEDALTFTAALHTYLAVDDAFAARVTGLAGLTYRDAITRAPGTQSEPVLLPAGAVNRVYARAPESIEVHDGGRTIVLESAGFRDVVVWNPGHEGEAALGDMGGGDAKHMLCVEPAVIEEPVVLGAGTQWRGMQRLMVG